MTDHGDSGSPPDGETPSLRFGAQRLFERSLCKTEPDSLHQLTGDVSAIIATRTFSSLIRAFHRDA